MPKGHKCTCCGKTFYTAPREGNLEDHCPKCALEMDAFNARIKDLQRVVETWGIESGLSPFECYEAVELLNMRRRGEDYAIRR